MEQDWGWQCAAVKVEKEKIPTSYTRQAFKKYSGFARKDKSPSVAVKFQWKKLLSAAKVRKMVIHPVFWEWSPACGIGASCPWCCSVSVTQTLPASAPSENGSKTHPCILWDALVLGWWVKVCTHCWLWIFRDLRQQVCFWILVFSSKSVVSHLGRAGNHSKSVTYSYK